MATSGPEPECVNCGARLLANTPRCQVCGTPTHTAGPTRRCPHCSTPAAQQAKTCLMCGAPLDRVPLRAGLAGVSWVWGGALALIAVLLVLGWNYWRNQPQPVIVVSTPAPKVTPPPTLQPTPTPAPSPSATPSLPASPTPIIHEVQSGETIIYIASYYGTSPEAIMQANGLNESSARLLHIGQPLLIPSVGAVGGPVPGATAQPPQVIHEVQSGETLSSIADKYDTTVAVILTINNLSSPDLIYVGQQLVVPLMPPTATPTSTPTPTPSSTPSPPYPAPQLLAPADGAIFAGGDTVILLTWASVGILRDNQVYLVELERPDGSAPVAFTTQATSWRVPADLHPTGQQPTLTWQVTVMQRLNPASPEPPEWKPLSPPTEARRFEWR